MGPSARECLDALKQQIDQVVDLPDSEWAYVSRQYKMRSFPAGSHLLAAGCASTHDYWIASGLVRLYYVSDQGRELTKGFAGAGSVVGCYASRVFGTPAEFSIQALEKTSALCLPAAVSDGLLERHPAWERLRRLRSAGALTPVNASGMEAP